MQYTFKVLYHDEGTLVLAKGSRHSRDGVGAMMRNVLLAQRAVDDYAYTDWFYE